NFRLTDWMYGAGSAVIESLCIRILADGAWSASAHTLVFLNGLISRTVDAFISSALMCTAAIVLPLPTAPRTGEDILTIVTHQLSTSIPCITDGHIVHGPRLYIFPGDGVVPGTAHMATILLQRPCIQAHRSG